MSGFTSYHDEPNNDIEEQNETGTPVASGDYNDLVDREVSVGFIAVVILMTGVLGGLFFVFAEKYNRFIRFWAYQTIFVFLPIFLVQVLLAFGMIFASDPRGWTTANFFFSLFHYCLAVFLAWHAYRGARTGVLFKVPVVGSIALARALNAGPPPTGARLQLL
mmetsp:Transcript_19302/g.33188  ORF Transcript_19302/g.33188 Transcript_19302/m.33188 type:complete len:163 (+) Transcript_19302:42-530(+)|eukprot:CAMPEP_0168591698 /NCGR_PEP_ID=MMETSP0420-20121227/7285_1 /TAXON_ID=498008 /ORGANISM="Pessonella sp." /LENGTH=162 /DNA_ID=CAMNT_0008627531 /DNA_START=28 /DNA_END=516 /DNA_ORIENTATION=+